MITHPSRQSETLLLKSWRPDPPRDPRLRRKLALSFLFLASLCAFGWIVLQSFSRPELQLVILGPSALQKTNLATANEIDLPQVVSSANAKHVGKLAVESGILNRSATETNASTTTVSLSTPLTRLESSLSQSVHRHSSLVVYLSGVLSVGPFEPTICENSQDAIHSGNSLEVSQLIRMLQRIPCKQILVYVDAIAPIANGENHIASAIAWDNLLDRIEKELLRPQSTPISVQLGLNSAMVTPRACTLSPFATRLGLTIADESISKRMTLKEFQDRIEGSDHHSSQRLVSSNWPLETESIRFPSLGSVRKKESREIQGSTDKPMSILSVSDESLSRDFDSIITDASAAELFSLCDRILTRWQISKQAVSQFPLSIPEPLSRSEANPFLFQSLQESFFKLRAASQLVSDGIDLAQIRLFTQCVHSIDKGIPFPSDAPLWIRSLPTNSPLVRSKTCLSLVANEMFANLGLVEKSLDDRSVAVLDDLVKRVTNRSTFSASGMSDWLKEWPEELRCTTEATWAGRVLEQTEISDESKRLFLHARLLATRLAADPLTAQWSKKSLLEGDSIRNQAERILFDRAQSGWGPISEQLIRRSIVSYSQGIEQVNDARERVRKTDIAWNGSNPNGQKDQAADGITETSFHFPKPVAAMESFAQTWFDALAPWNEELAKQWSEKASSHKKELIAAGANVELQLKSVVGFDRFVHSQKELLFQWIESHSSDIPRDSHLWVFAKRLWVAKPELLSKLVSSSKPASQHCVQLNLERLANERFGANSLESSEIDRQWNWWTEVASDPLATTVSPRSPSLQIQLDKTLDLTGKDVAETNLGIQCSPAGMQTLQLEAHFDEQALEVKLDGRSVSPSKPITILEPRDQGTRLQVSVAIDKRSGSTSKRPLVFVATRGKEQRRESITIHTPSQPMVELTYGNGSCSLNSAQSPSLFSAPPFFSAMFPNQTNRLSIGLKNLAPTTSTYLSRVLVLKDRRAEPPKGTVSMEEAKRWLQGVGEPIVVGAAKPMQLNLGQAENLSFLPSPWPADQPLPIIEKLFVEITDPSKELVQFATWIPYVVHPKQYLRPSVYFDATQQSIVVSSERLQSSPQSVLGTSLNIQLLNLPDMQVASNAIVDLEPEKRGSQTALSTSTCRASRALLLISVDHWKPCFVYEVDLQRSGEYEPSKSFSAMRLNLVDPKDVIAPQQGEIEVEIEPILHCDAFDEGRDSIDVGFDRNENRSLDDDVAMRLNGTSSIRFAWRGVDENGSIAVQSLVEPHRVKIPNLQEWNRWVPAMASLRIGDRLVSSNSLPCVFDRVPPKIESLRIIGKQPCQLGVPIQIEVQVNDDGLAGGVLVEGGWSTNGELEFHPTLLVVPGIYRERDRWLLTIPTATLPSGKSILLVRARDRAGMLSKTRSTSIEILTLEEIAAREASITTLVRGDVLFGTMPQKGMNVRLLAKAVAEGKGDKPPEEIDSSLQKPVATATTEADGHFLLNHVPSGEYTLEIGGISRGMRVKRTQALTVNALGIPAEIHVRLDQKQ